MTTKPAVEIDLDKLEALAKAATPGRWIASGPEFYATGVHEYRGAPIAQKPSSEPRGETVSNNMCFIAYANPATVLALIAQARASQAVAEPVTCVICGSDEPRTGTCGSDDPRALCNLAAPAAQQSEAVAVELQGVAEGLAGDSGFWESCSGCYETEDGHAVGHYPYSHIFKCVLGSGCRECGGLGAAWDSTDYAEMARDWTASERDSAQPTEAGAPTGAADKWLPTAENVNALPEGVRAFVHDLATRCDPAGDTAALTGLRDQMDGVQLMYRKAADALETVRGCFHAAEIEGLTTALAETADEHLKDLVERRLMHALYAAQDVEAGRESAAPVSQQDARIADLRTALQQISETRFGYEGDCGTTRIADDALYADEQAAAMQKGAQ